MLVWLSEAGWQAARAAQPQHTAALTQWQRRDWPAVVRRLDADAAPDEVCLGLPVPPDSAGRKVRIALRVQAAHVVRSSDAMALHAALPFSGAWHEQLNALCDEATALDLRVFGSLAMQALTGLQYVSPTSDVDVLFHPASRHALDEGVALLERYTRQLPLDGEIVFPGGAAVSWKEWQMAMRHPAKVMVKELHAVRLADTASLLATLTTQEAQ
ncbi:malonate decarboxylase holo-[acyl-carrier-protein] synthase [Duganella sp. FT135W]|uniref:Malonate decarboxylase holo-[acyl-carrier-protein] synthase n=2 Tax=Duganella flavida TaxID=2692175 RepID=A0A6L8K8Z2_9BURK|nr:malonate decarboxylase holo-[acyl-carrier-protein] synthase [Duganella flavida]